MYGIFFFILSTLCFLLLLVPNDEDGDTVFMPIKSNDDDEPVRLEKENKELFVFVE
jgi:hypothetical protein